MKIDEVTGMKTGYIPFPASGRSVAVVLPSDLRRARLGDPPSSWAKPPGVPEESLCFPDAVGDTTGSRGEDFPSLMEGKANWLERISGLGTTERAEGFGIKLIAHRIWLSPLGDRWNG